MRKQSIPKKSLQSNHYDFQVEQRPLSDADGNPSHVMGNYRTDTNECIGSTSKHYEIVNNGTVIEKVEQALERTNLGQYESEKLVTRLLLQIVCLRRQLNFLFEFQSKF